MRPDVFPVLANLAEVRARAEWARTNGRVGIPSLEFGGDLVIVLVVEESKTLTWVDQPFYDALPRMRLAYRGLSGGSHTEAFTLAELGRRIEVLDWSELVSPRPGGGRDLPTWLRNGWDAREWTRALDYAEGTKSLVIAAPDREPDAYLDWGRGAEACRINPVVSEAEAAITDCVFPSGWTASPTWTELWTVLRGSAVVRQTLAPLHAAATETQIASGVTLVVPGGARVTVEDASDDLVVRRLAGSCAHNGHWAMMEAKLVADGVAGLSRA